MRGKARLFGPQKGCRPGSWGSVVGPGCSGSPSSSRRAHQAPGLPAGHTKQKHQPLSFQECPFPEARACCYLLIQSWTPPSRAQQSPPPQQSLTDASSSSQPTLRHKLAWGKTVHTRNRNAVRFKSTFEIFVRVEKSPLRTGTKVWQRFDGSRCQEPVSRWVEAIWFWTISKEPGHTADPPGR